MSPLARVLALPVRAYRLCFSPFVGHNCRFQPTCSAYALEALEHHGAMGGSWLAVRRILRCHPWGGSGIDNVPQAQSSRSKKMMTSPRRTPKRDM
jgi:putative membrane protein insertion efficiency factor